MSLFGKDQILHIVGGQGWQLQKTVRPEISLFVPTSGCIEPSGS